MRVNQPFTVEIRESKTHRFGEGFGYHEELIEKRGMDDPFHTTSIQPRGWRRAWAVLRGHYSTQVRVDAKPQVVGRVMEAIADAESSPTLHANLHSPLGQVMRSDGTLDPERLARLAREQGQADAD